MSTDPILDAILGDGEYEEPQEANFDEYGKGRWPDAVLQEVTPRDEEGRKSFLVKCNLKGDSMPFTFFVDFPGELPQENGDAEHHERAVKQHQIKVNRLKTLIHATGTFVTFNEKGKVASTTWKKGLEADFDKLSALLQHLVGQVMGLNVKYRTYTNRDGEEKTVKDIWGLTPKQR
jgi:hypothetical protein